MSDLLAALAHRWRDDAALLRDYGSTGAAEAAERHAAELEAALRDAGDEVLTLAQAAGESGYSVRRLRELVAAGRVAQAGRHGAPRIRRRDLPRRAGRTPSVYDAMADARALNARRLPP